MITELLVHENNCVTSSSSSDEPYGEWHENQEYSISKVTIKEENDPSYNVFPLPDVSLGDTVHVLYIVYSTGDSFGRSAGNGEVIAVYKSKDIAEQAFSIFDEKQEEYSVTLPFETPDGVKFHEISNPAAGYFEHLETLELESFKVKSRHTYEY